SPPNRTFLVLRGDAIDDALLRDHPLPEITGDKDDRGAVVVVGGEAETPGGVMLAALAALRSGAGRAHIVTDPSVVPALAVAAPELRVSALPGPPSAPDLRADRGVLGAVRRAQAVVVGTGCIDRARAGRLLQQCALLVADSSVLVVDAAALSILADDAGMLIDLGSRAVLLPNIAEAARLHRQSREEVENDPQATLVELVGRLAATVAVRGSTTWIADPDHGPYVECGGHPALGTAGSGDVLAGLVAGLAAGGASPVDALLWGVHVHAAAGAALAARHGGIGLLARELLEVLPSELNRLGRRVPPGASGV
ncbi:MAG TPA: ADP/ATP-dependent (S)-NAD(P)H-hydrate dehydratase, partial [Acidimicrobiia bacterium]|nr:ADP/ATP-dependent (S)-NAD(P)H-hydrate dehydratase [Acidimicrobiia bacterium]